MNKSGLLCVIIMYAAMCACNNNNNSQTEQYTPPADTTPVNQAAAYNFLFTIGNLPSPFTVLNEILKAELPVNTDLLNPYTNADHYNTSLKLSFNYGIYGVDLGYLVINNHLPEMVDYYSCTKKVADKLNLGETFDQFGTRFDNNHDNKDSLIKIIDEAYSATDNYLKSNERLISATEILTGSWLEGQYLTVNLLLDQDRTDKNEAIYERVYEQGLHLDNIVKTIAEFKDDKQLMDLKNDFEDLLNHYKEIKNPEQITKPYLQTLSQKIAKVRNKIIS